jgi:hypothetical protein
MAPYTQEPSLLNTTSFGSFMQHHSERARSLTPASQVLAQAAPGYLDNQNTKSLPLELRQQIWKLAMPDPVIIPISFKDPKCVISNTRLNLLRVCRESRVEVLKQYELFEGVYRKQFYIDFSRDTVRLLHSLLGLEKQNLEAMTLLATKVQRLIIPGEVARPYTMIWKLANSHRMSKIIQTILPRILRVFGATFTTTIHVSRFQK